MKFNLVQVFVNKLGKFGNPVAIVIDENRKLNKKQRQAMAAKLNFSETVFVNDLKNISVRIFNPVSDMPFSGYAVLGVAYFLKHELNLNVTAINCAGGSVPVTNNDELTWITAPLAIMPPWNFKELDDSNKIKKLTPEQFSDQKHIMVWAWIDRNKHLIRARTFAQDWGIPEDAANGSGAMMLAAKLKQSLKIIHGQGSELFAEPVNNHSAKIGGRIKLLE